MQREKIDETYDVAAIQEELELCCNAIESSGIHADIVEVSASMAKRGRNGKSSDNLRRLVTRLAKLGRQITFMLS